MTWANVLGVEKAGAAMSMTLERSNVKRADVRGALALMAPMVWRDGVVTVSATSQSLSLEGSDGAVSVPMPVAGAGVASVSWAALKAAVAGVGVVELVVSYGTLVVGSVVVPGIGPDVVRPMFSPPQGGEMFVGRVEAADLAVVVVAASSDEARPIFCSVLVEADGTMVATDSYRLHGTRVGVCPPAPVLVPAAVVRAIVKAGGTWMVDGSVGEYGRGSPWYCATCDGQLVGGPETGWSHAGPGGNGLDQEHPAHPHKFGPPTEVYPEGGPWSALPDPLPSDPYDEDRYCEWCGNGEWKLHAPWCKWADARDGGV